MNEHRYSHDCLCEQCTATERMITMSVNGHAVFVRASSTEEAKDKLMAAGIRGKEYTRIIG